MTKEGDSCIPVKIVHATMTGTFLNRYTNVKNEEMLRKVQ